MESVILFENSDGKYKAYHDEAAAIKEGLRSYQKYITDCLSKIEPDNACDYESLLREVQCDLIDFIEDNYIDSICYITKVPFVDPPASLEVFDKKIL